MLTRLFLFLLLLCSFASAATVFNFNEKPLNTYTPFAMTKDGITVSFASNGDPGGFALTFYSSPSLSGNVLFQPGPADMDNLALSVDFDQALSSISLNFAINGTSSQRLELAAYLAGQQVGDVFATGVRPPGAFFPEGLIGFSGASFDSVILTSEALDFAIDNVTVTAPAPEPGTIVITGLVLAGGITSLVRRRFSLATVHLRS